MWAVRTEDRALAIVAIDPVDWENVNAVQIDSDASENEEATTDIENWAAEHGFARTTEYWLRQSSKTRDGGYFAASATA